VACVSERYNATSEWWIFFTELGELLVFLVAIWFQITEINNWDWNWKILKLINSYWKICLQLTETVTEISEYAQL